MEVWDNRTIAYLDLYLLNLGRILLCIWIETQIFGEKS